MADWQGSVGWKAAKANRIENQESKTGSVVKCVCSLQIFFKRDHCKTYRPSKVFKAG